MDLRPDGSRTRRWEVVSSSGVSTYITKAATVSTLDRLAEMAPGSIVVMTFTLPLELIDDGDRPGLQGAVRGARASGTPWISFYSPEEIVTLAREAGFAEARSVPTAEVAERYLTGRSDGLRAAGGEGMLLART